MQSLTRLALAAALSVATLPAQAALVARSGGMVYDTVQNITWLQNWNTNGVMNWNTAYAWADNLVFTNVQSNIYWSGTEYAQSPASAWDFYTDSGAQSLFGKGLALYAVAVRTGDVAASVPEPQTLALALLALGATMVARRRRPV